MALKYFGTAAFEEATSLELVENVYQGEIYREGKAYTGKYSDGTNAIEKGKYLYLDIQRVKVWDDVSRKLDPDGVLPNSGLYNKNNTIESSIQVNDDIYTLKLDEMLDHSAMIPKIAVGINGLTRIENFAKNYRLSITKTINVSRTAHYLFNAIHSVVAMTLGDGTTLTAGETLARNVYNYTPTELTTNKNAAYERFMEAVDSMLDGDIDNGFQSFAPDRCQIVVKPFAKTDIGKAHLNAASDIAQKLMANGTENPFDATKEARISLPDGEFGQVDGVLISYAANDIWKSALKYFGSSITADTTKVTEAIAGMVIAADACFSGRVFQGIESGIDPFTRATVLVPDDRFGTEIISPFAVKLVTKGATALTVADFSAAQAELVSCVNPGSQTGFKVVYR